MANEFEDAILNIFKTGRSKRIKFLTTIFLILLSFNVYGNTTTNWKLFKSVDKMTNELKSCLIYSKSVAADRKLSFPYSVLEGNVIIYYQSFKTLKPFFSFNMYINLNKGSYKLKKKFQNVEEAYRLIDTRIKFDKEVKNVQLMQRLSYKKLLIFNEEIDEKQLLSSNKILLEIDWYNKGKIYFEYNLNGMTKAIKNMKENCKNLK